MFKKEGKITNKISFGKNGQVSVFVILAIVIVAGIVLFFVFRGGVSNKVPAELEPVYSYYLSCVSEGMSNGISVLGQRGGYIDGIEFSPGSSFMPFSSELNFLGVGVPYWYYISGNNVVKEQKPSREKMEQELNIYLSDWVEGCDFSSFENEGYVINFGKASVKSNIESNLVEGIVEQPISISFGENSWTSKSHNIQVDSNLGKFYDISNDIYSSFKEDMFLENYGVDVLRLYAPVDGSEISCGSKIWNVEDIRGGLIDALVANVPATKISGNYYNLGKKENSYFVRDVGREVDVNVNFLYLSDFPMKLDVWPSENGLLKADPVGLQEGLGLLGFCYVPYHFVYDFAYPVLIQLFSGNEMFQFPVVVSIVKNKPREGVDVEGYPSVVPELCENKLSNYEIFTYDVDLNPVPSRISYKCFDTVCGIGESLLEGNDAVLRGKLPQCVNGFVIADSEGFRTKREMINSVNGGVVDIILSKEYELDLVVRTGGKDAEKAVVTFKRDDGSISVVYPEQTSVKLVEGQYDVEVYVYSDTSINLAGSSRNECVKVPKTGLFGFLGFTEEKCFNINVPSQVVDSGVSGGGKQKYYIAESELRNSGRVVINTENFGIPKKVEDVQINYNKIEVSNLNIEFI